MHLLLLLLILIIVCVISWFSLLSNHKENTNSNTVQHEHSAQQIHKIGQRVTDCGNYGSRTAGCMIKLLIIRLSNFNSQVIEVDCFAGFCWQVFHWGSISEAPIDVFPSAW